MHLRTIFLISINLFSFILTKKDEIIVNTQNGDIRGTTMKSMEGNEYFAFIGIPYAEPPIGELRFKSPIPKKPWTENGILEATKDGSICPQFDILSRAVVGSEDCLFLNVFTKQFSSDKKYPVIVWIHGGGFMMGHGSSWMYGPSRFIAEDIVLVSLNYRLNVLGFLATNDNASPGNYGLLDQVEALKWVKANINQFGGDADQITLLGHSAGSTSVFYHILSSQSVGLFHRAIAMSGPPLCSWSFQRKPQYWAEKLGTILKCPIEHYELINCLHKLPASDIVKAAHPFLKEVMIPFSPVLDGKFVTIEPQKAFEEGKIPNKVPIVMGLTRDEGVGLYGIITRKLEKYSENLLKQFVRQSINYNKDYPNIVELIKERYLKNIDISNKLELAIAMSKFFGDATMNVCFYETVKYLINAEIETQVYSFDFAANFSILNLLGFKDYMGVGHADDMWFLFDGRLFNNFMRNDRIKQMANKYTKLYTNFAKFGDASRNLDLKWPRSTPGNIVVYHIDEETYVENYDPEGDPRTDFWLKEIPQSMKNAEDLNIKGEL